MSLNFCFSLLSSTFLEALLRLDVLVGGGAFETPGNSSLADLAMNDISLYTIMRQFTEGDELSDPEIFKRSAFGWGLLWCFKSSRYCNLSTFFFLSLFIFFFFFSSFFKVSNNSKKNFELFFASLTSRLLNFWRPALICLSFLQSPKIMLTYTKPELLLFCKSLVFL